MKELPKATKAALRGRRELTFARRDSAKSIGFCVMTGHGEIVDLRRLLGSQLYGSFGEPFIEALIKKGIAAMTLREGLPDIELQSIVEMLLGPHAHEELRKELLSKPLRHSRCSSSRTSSGAIESCRGRSVYAPRGSPAISGRSPTCAASA